MPPTPQPLPDELAGHPFSAAAVDRAGLSRGRLRRRDLWRPYHGVRVLTPVTTVRSRCEAYAVRMKPGQAFSHITAAQLHGLPLPLAVQAATELHLVALHPAPAPQTRNVVGHRLKLAVPVVDVAGLVVVDVVEAWCQLGAVLSLDDLIVIADHLLGSRRRRPAASRDQLVEAASSRRRAGSGLLMRALREARFGSDSPQETRTRLLLCRAGLPEPLLNHPVTDDACVLIGHGDLVWPRQRVVVEYEGDQHRTDQRQFRYDITRYEQMRAAGWTVIRVSADDLHGQAATALVARVRAALVRP